MDIIDGVWCSEFSKAIAMKVPFIMYASIESCIEDLVYQINMVGTTDNSD